VKTRIVLFAVVILLLSACQPAAIATPQPTQPVQPTQPPAQPTDGTPDGISLVYSAVAQDVTLETVAAQPATDNGPYWEAAPEYRRLTLQGYPVADHMFKPQISVYPVADLASANENMGKIATDLQALLQTQQAGDHLPFLPLFNAAQVIHPQVKYLSFQNGQGVRYITQYDQAPIPINNHELIYTFQGLTSDGQYYISAVLPLTHPSLPADDKMEQSDFESFVKEFSTYLPKLVGELDQQPADSFTPDLNKLDALISSIEVK